MPATRASDKLSRIKRIVCRLVLHEQATAIVVCIVRIVFDHHVGEQAAAVMTVVRALIQTMPRESE